MREDLASPQLPTPPASVETAIDIALRTRPDLRLARSSEEVAQAGLRLARAQGAPDVTSFTKFSYGRSVFDDTPVGALRDRDKLLTFVTTGWYYADPMISAGIGLFILPRTWLLLRDAVGVLLEGTPADVNLAALREAIKDVAGVADVHDLHVWSLTSDVNAMSVHAVLADHALP
ncbi:MAG: TolC family protein [Pyrinomonadaceae bacterium]